MTTIPPDIERKINELQNRIRQADALEQARRVDDAQVAYQACLQQAAQERFPLLEGQLVQIWMGLGFCEADRNAWQRALEWYHRVEALLASAPAFNPHPKSPEAQANAQRWTPFLPAGVKIIFRPDYPVEMHLAELCDSIALAYDNDNQLARAQTYYQRSVTLHAKADQPARVADVWLHQAVGCQRRQQWFELEQVAENGLRAAERAQAQPLLLAAQRFLAQAHLNQNRPFKALAHLGQVVVLARALKDAQVAREEGLLRELMHSLRQSVLQRGELNFLEPVVAAEALLNDPHLAQDQARLQQWQKAHPTSAPPPGAFIPVGAITSLAGVALLLEHFARCHCGAPTRTVQRAKKGFLGLFNQGTEKVQRPVWTITEEEMQVFQKDAQGQLVPGSARCAILTLFGQPEVIISVALTAAECTVMVMEERTVPGVKQTALFGTAHESVPLDLAALLTCLNSFIQRGLFVKTKRGLQYVSPKSP